MAVQFVSAVGKIEKYFLGKQVAVIFRKRIQIILVKPSQADSLFNPLLIPLKCLRTPALSPDQDGTDRFQYFLSGILRIQTPQRPVVKAVKMPGGQRKPRRCQRELLPCGTVSGAKGQHLQLKRADAPDQIRFFRQQPAGMQIEKRASHARFKLASHHG